MVPVKYVIMSFFYVALLNLNYIFIKTSGFYLYLGDWFDFDFSFFSLFLSVVFSFFTLYLFLKKINGIYVTLFSAVILLGVVPGIVIYSYSTDESKYYFYFFYVFLLFFFSFFRRRKVGFSKFHENSQSLKLDMRPFRYIGLMGFLLLVYFLLKNISYLSFSNLDDVYVQRAISKELVVGFEKYLYLFMKYGAGYAFVFLAFYFKSYLYFIAFSVIFFFDFLLGAHKFSLFVIILVFIFFISLKYKRFLKIKTEYLFFSIAFYFLLTLSAFMHLVKDTFVPYVIAIYDRVYFVLAGIFARNFDYVQSNGLFYGGSSSIGAIVGAEPIDVYYAIGAYYWADGVMANTDIISDAYVNFGALGVFITLLLFWAFFNKVDERFFYQNRFVFLPVVTLYSISAVFSLGLSVALLSGGLMYLIFYLKFRV